MNDEQAKEAFLAQCPVVSKGVNYKCISALIHCIENNKIILKCKLQDRHVNSSTITDPRFIEHITLGGE